MIKIWKYKLEIAQFQSIEMPEGSRILTLQMQMNIPCIWASVIPDQKKVKVKIMTVGTGQRFNADNLDRYIGTYQFKKDLTVYHVFTLKPGL